MISLAKKRDQQGFTIVELLIVIVVIGILAALVVTTYAGIQAKARDSKRRTDIQALQTQVEAFYATNNFYPALANLNSTTWRADHMKSLDKDALYDPSAPNTTDANPLSGSEATDSGKKYGYVALNSASATCADGDTTCATYTLSAYLESSKQLYTKANLD